VFLILISESLLKKKKYKRYLFLEGGSTKPNQNLKLAQLIEQAKKANMPSATIKNFLEKMEATKNKNHKGIIEVRGPGGYIMLISYLTHNPKAFAMDVYSKLKKTRYNQIFVICYKYIFFYYIPELIIIT